MSGRSKETDEMELSLNTKFGTGVLVYAFDNEHIEYMRMAKECARRVEVHWKLPVSVVTDVKTAARVQEGDFDRVIVIDEGADNKRFYQDYALNMSFRNGRRCEAQIHTPYERTVLIDTDFLVQTRSVLDAWAKSDLSVSRAAYSVVQPRDLPADMVYVSEQNQIDMFWATVVCWNARSAKAQVFFRNWKKVVDNYSFYSTVFKFAKAPVRNDFAVTVALEMMRAANKSTDCVLRYAIPTLTAEHELLQLHPMQVRSKDGCVVNVYSDLHVMNKRSLLRELG
jgi:hypothetical protein